MTAQQMWKEYAAACGAGEAYDAWAFGADADALAALVLRGEKTATASASRCMKRSTHPCRSRAAQCGAGGRRAGDVHHPHGKGGCGALL